MQKHTVVGPPLDSFCCVYMSCHVTGVVQVVTACDRMVSSGIGYTDASRAFSVSVKDLASHFQENEVIAVSVCVECVLCECVCVECPL